MTHSRLLTVTLLALTVSPLRAADWTQWRGNNRDGIAVDSPALISALPDDGLKPVWRSEPIGSGKNDGGWGSPVVVQYDGEAGQRVYLFTHKRIKLREVPKKKFPWLAPDKRVGMTDKEYAEYEVKRRDEDEFIAQSYAFRETVYCLSGASGETLWKNESDSRYTRFPQSGSPTVVDGKLYILGAGRHVRCIDALTGEDVWTVKLQGEFRDEFWQSCFVVEEGLAVCLCGRLIALDVRDGRVVWEGDPKTTNGSHASPVVWRHRGTSYIVSTVGRGETACFELKSGREVWRVKSEAGVATPVIAGNRLITYGNSRKKGLRCFVMSESGAEHAWTFNGCQDKGSSPVVVGDFVFVQGEKRLACVNLETGDDEWMTTLDLGRPQYTSLVAADSKVYYALEGMLCFDATPTGFQPLIEAKFDDTGLMATEASFRERLGLAALEKEQDGFRKAEKLYNSKIGRQGPLDCASPAIADGRIFIRLKNGVACYDLKKESAEK